MDATATSTPTTIISVTDKAVQEIRRTLEEKEAGLCVRLEVQGGGCSGLSYKLSYDAAQERDHVIEIKGVRVIVDRKSAIYLRGTTLDFNDGLNGRGFTFINPNATNTCGCGESFSV